MCIYLYYMCSGLQRQHWRVSVPRVAWLEVEPGVMGDSSSRSSLSTGSSGIAEGSSSLRWALIGVFLALSSSVEIANRGISMIAEQQRRRTVRGGLESLSVCEDSDTDRRLRKLNINTRKLRHNPVSNWMTEKLI